jgi:uncharacterized phage protein (TIGR02218 family)
MSKTLSAGFATAIAQGTSKFARIFSITRPDGEVRRFTDHDQDLSYGGNTYYADATVDVTAITTSKAGGAQAADMYVSFGTGSNAITYEDAAGGLYDHSSILITAVNTNDLATTGMVLMSGTLGAFQMDDVGFGNVQLNGLLQKGINLTGERYSPECRASLGDTRCGVNIATYTTTGTVVSVTSNRKFVATLADDEVNDYYAFGILTWTSGNNNGQKMEVLTHFQTGTDDDITMAFTFPKTIQIGDTFSLTAGCDKRPATCQAKFANILNFRGEPFVPTADKLKDLPTSNITTDPQGNY